MAAPIAMSRFGRDHWSLFAYCECRAVDHGGRLDLFHLRLDGENHPTKLAVGEVAKDHSDADCIEDLEAAGLLENIGTGVNPVVRLSDEGWRVVSLLRQHKANGGQFVSFKV